MKVRNFFTIQKDNYTGITSDWTEEGIKFLFKSKSYRKKIAKYLKNLSEGLESKSFKDWFYGRRKS